MRLISLADEANGTVAKYDMVQHRIPKRSRRGFHVRVD